MACQQQNRFIFKFYFFLFWFAPHYRLCHTKSPENSSHSDQWGVHFNPFKALTEKRKKCFGSHEIIIVVYKTHRCYYVVSELMKIEIKKKKKKTKICARNWLHRHLVIQKQVSHLMVKYEALLNVLSVHQKKNRSCNKREWINEQIKRSKWNGFGQNGKEEDNKKMLMLNFYRATIASHYDIGSKWAAVFFFPTILLLHLNISFHIGEPSRPLYVIEYWYTKIALQDRHHQNNTAFFCLSHPLNTMGYRIKNSLSSWPNMYINICVVVDVEPDDSRREGHISLHVDKKKLRRRRQRREKEEEENKSN